MKGLEPTLQLKRPRGRAGGTLCAAGDLTTRPQWARLVERLRFILILSGEYERRLSTGMKPLMKKSQAAQYAVNFNCSLREPRARSSPRMHSVCAPKVFARRKIALVHTDGFDSANANHWALTFDMSGTQRRRCS